MNVMPFKYKNQYYAVVADENMKYGIIDTAGNCPWKQFAFVHSFLFLNKYSDDKNHLWFFSKGNSRRYSLTNEVGTVKFNEELPELSVNDYFSFSSILLDENGRKKIFDCKRMEWVSQPKNLHIIGFDWASKINFHDSQNAGKFRADLYFLVEDGKNRYYVDRQGKVLYPPE